MKGIIWSMIKFISKKQLAKEIEELKSEIKSLKEELNDLRNFNEQVIKYINNAFFGVEDEKEEKKKIDDKQKQIFTDMAGVFDWSD